MTPRSTTICRAITSTAAVIALCSPGAAAANPLLSGYGGPGQGTQVILGGGLVNPPGGGGPAGQAAAAGTSELTVTAVQAGSSRATGAATGKPRHRQAASTPPRAGASPPSKPLPGGAGPAPIALAGTGASGATLGLSSGDLVLILFVLAGLAVTGTVTRRLTRRTP